jgi:hypothetical protein
MIEKFLKPEEINTIELLEKEVEKVLLLKDMGVVKMVVATIIANRMFLDPVWLLLVAPPSGGKTELIMAISGLEFVFGISDLTVNTFASGQKKVGKETSLLLKINNGIMAFKDFTSILSKNREARGEIMKQLREIYDGEYIKRTGTGDDVTWRGKVGAIAGCTEIIYRYLEELSAMGDRFIMYNIEQPDRVEMSRRVLENADDMGEKRDHLKKCFTYFINQIISRLDEEEITIEESMKEELLEVADFATRARSAVLTDFKSGMVDFVPSPEMPARMTAQLYTLASAFVAINKTNPHLHPNHEANKGRLTDQEKKLLFKTAFDSIPKTRRNAIYPLAQYTGGVSTAGLATYLELPSESVRKYLAQVNALGICTRKKEGGKQGDMWMMKPKYREIMLKIEDLKTYDGSLVGDESANESDEGFENFENYKKEQETVASFDVVI